eukprot:3431226-Pyramimonas_sp.AAC.1
MNRPPEGRIDHPSDDKSSAHLGRHPLGRAPPPAGGRHEGALPHAAEAKVRDLHPPSVVDEDVGALEVQVEDRRLARVQIVHPPRHRQHHPLHQQRAGIISISFEQRRRPRAPTLNY